MYNQTVVLQGFFYKTVLQIARFALQGGAANRDHHYQQPSKPFISRPNLGVGVDHRVDGVELRKAKRVEHLTPDLGGDADQAIRAAHRGRRRLEGKKKQQKKKKNANKYMRMAKNTLYYEKHAGGGGGQENYAFDKEKGTFEKRKKKRFMRRKKQTCRVEKKRFETEK